MAVGPLEQAVLDSIEARGENVTGADKALQELALSYARQIDFVPVDAGYDRTKALYLGPHLLKALGALGCTPEARGIPEDRDRPVAVVSVMERMKAAGGGRAG